MNTENGLVRRTYKRSPNNDFLSKIHQTSGHKKTVNNKNTTDSLFKSLNKF